MTKTLISFVIPHRGREQYLQQTINSIKLQEIDLSLIEVIIVTQNDQLSEKTLAFSNYLKLSVYPRPGTDSISSLRNHGAENAKGEYLAFIDADICLSPDWTRQMLEELQKINSGRVLVSAVQDNSQNAKSVERIRTALNNISEDSNVDSLHGSNLFLKSETFITAGGFPAELKTCEDVYFTNQVSKLGVLFLSSKATFIHLGEDRSYRDMFRKEIWRGLSNLQSVHGRKVPIRELPSILIPVILMLLFISSLSLFLMGQFMPAVISTLVLILPVCAYAIRLQKHSEDQNIRFIDSLVFYMVYFSARSVGSYKGLYVSLMKT